MYLCVCVFIYFSVFIYTYICIYMHRHTQMMGQGSTISAPSYAFHFFSHPLKDILDLSPWRQKPVLLLRVWWILSSPDLLSATYTEHYCSIPKSER